ncbi:ATP-dependent RNA helicase HrpA [Betaproteobacteria bacterium GR16-43]|nr:ATP-dependent RNA helicase HrpA [Betaproteobacteria bacterium GR16-43]
MNDLPADLFAGTLAADHPKIAALAAQVRERERRDHPVGRERALLGELLERSRARHAARLAALPRPSFPEDLPIAQKRDDIAALIGKHPVVIVCGETGSGKTTQIPKICLALKRGAAGLIGCTQPRRIAARSLSKRLAVELPGSPKGFVGHKIRFQDETRPESVIKVMTDGILLAEIHSDRELRAYDTIIVDEAHERSLNIDFLLGYLKRLVAIRSDLKVIVTSATIDTQRFSEFFGGAPVIEVSGRTYPVEVRYRPEFFEVEQEDDEPVDLNEALVKAVDEIHRTSRTGDVLVFLPGEREIREAAEHLRKHGPKGLEILPLFSRLSAEEQDRVFEPSGQRRVVLSTNVAETSLTVPGIHYVIDAGLARVKRYSPRQKIDQLRIEPISQAAAKQRAGRCGRVASGIAIRLYAEADFLERPTFTTPEILRTSLASVILRMASLDVGEIAAFPFVEPPTPRQIQDGYQVLLELGAIDEKRRLTPIGQELARLPVDPRIGRMLIGAREFHCGTEMIILAAALSIQDPRDRPQDKRQESDRAHEEFRDDASDFVQLMNLWKFFDEAFVHKKSTRKLYDTCREHFLSYVRMREWRDLAGQLREMASELRIRENPTPATYEQVHRALLTGLVTNVGLKAQDGDHYNAPRGIPFAVWPGSGLKKNRPRWIVAGELQETTRIYARNVARVEPDWIEKAAAHLVTRQHAEPHWDRERGEVLAYESVSLYGLSIVARRKVSFGKLDPPKAREVFIAGALVDGEFDTPLAFFAANRRLVKEVEELEHRARRPDVLVDDSVIQAWYHARIPDDVRDARSFDAWYREAAKATPNLLFLTREELMRHGAESVTEQLFPREMKIGEATFPLAYRFEPAHPLDGVTMTVPLALLNQVEDAAVDWLVPGLVRDKVAWLMKALPKRVRTQLVPVPEHVTAFLQQERIGARPVREAVLAYASRRCGERLDDAIWSKDDMPLHFAMNLRVIDDAKRELAMSRDLGELRKRLGEAASLTLAKSKPGMEREGIKAWDFGDLPEEVSFRRGNQSLTGYPALVDEGESVSIRLFDAREKAAEAHRAGVKRLLSFELREQLKNLDRSIASQNALALRYVPAISADKVKEDLAAAIVDRAFFGEDALPRTAKAFEEQKKRAKARLPAVSEAVSRHAAAIATAYQEASTTIAQSGALGRVAQEARAQRDRLVSPGFLSRTPWERLEHLPRYLRGYALRLQKYRTNAERDNKHNGTVAGLWNQYEARAATDRDAERHDPKLEDFRWMIEELRISLFAQELRTPMPVSAKRLQKYWDEHLR